MIATAKGSFTVVMKPLDGPTAVEGVALGRSSLDKHFEGDLTAVGVGVGVGEMLTVLTPVEGSACYVAVERVTGTLQGRAGSFVFQHSGTMEQGANQFSIAVVPGSGSGALGDIAGTFKLGTVEGKHLYEFDYSLPSERDCLRTARAASSHD